MRQVAEVVRFAHDKKIVHRALSPQSILVTEPDGERLRIKIFNWQVGYRAGRSTSNESGRITGTVHVDHLVEDASTAYMAPEAVSEGDNTGEHLDVFSLGALAYHLFSGKPPAANALELSDKLRETKGLQISSVLNGAGEELQELIQWSTHPDVSIRLDSTTDFLELLDKVENELTEPDVDVIDDPAQAQLGDRLEGGITVKKRLGTGACSVALLVELAGQEYVLKVAVDVEHNDRLRDEGEVLGKLRHQHIVQFCETLEIGCRICLLMRQAGPETLGQRLRKEGRLHVDLLQRFGEDLLQVAVYLEEQGIPHRDIKPDNIAIAPVGRGDKLHAVPFDFSLSRTAPENILAGTRGYLDPFLPLRKPKRWDLHAERYAVAVTLYELATGNLPKWGDGASDPSYLECEVTIDAELFDANLRDEFTGFFGKALRRNPAERFDNAEEMLRAWRNCFEGIDEPTSISDHEGGTYLAQQLEEATLETQIPELGLGTRATNALDRVNVLTVRDLITFPQRQLNRLRGVGNKTRREITEAVRVLRRLLGTPEQLEPAANVAVLELTADEAEPTVASVDLLAQRITRTSPHARSDTERRAVNGLLGLDPELKDAWPSQSDVARHLSLTRARIGQVLDKVFERWTRDRSVTKLRDDAGEIIATSGGVMAVEELRDAILLARGSIQDEPQRSKLATAVARAAVEVERTMAEPRFVVRRDGNRVLVATTQDLADYACRLGREADKLAGEDPLVPPARVLQRFRAVGLPPGVHPLSDARLVRLAVAAAQIAAVSSRQEIYPRGMDARRALRLSQGALLGVPKLTVEQIRQRVSGRYPEAESLPDRPEQLDELLKANGFDFEWDPTAEKGIGAFISRVKDPLSVTSDTTRQRRLATQSGPMPAGEITPEIATARQFEERLQRALNDGAFIAMTVPPKLYGDARDEFCRRFPVRTVDFEALFIKALRDVAEQAKVKWDRVLLADAVPGNDDWQRLMLLVRRTIPQVEQEILASDKTVLLVYAGLLARYEQMDLLDRLREKIGRPGGIPGLWVLIPADDQRPLPVMDGKAVPTFGPGQRARIPESWVRNEHRANGNDQ